MNNILYLVASTTASPQNNNSWFEVLLIFMGALLGFAFSILTILITNAMQKSGKLFIYTKIVFAKTGNHFTWGARNNSAGGLTFHVPLWVEILNTSNVPNILRDFNLYLFNNGIEIGKMTQINKISEESLGIDGSYSFVIGPRSLSKIDCHFIIKQIELPEGSIFDEIKVSYYNTNGKQKMVHLKSLSNCWSTSPRHNDKNWIILNAKKMRSKLSHINL